MKLMIMKIFMNSFMMMYPLRKQYKMAKTLTTADVNEIQL